MHNINYEFPHVTGYKFAWSIWNLYWLVLMSSSESDYVTNEHEDVDKYGWFAISSSMQELIMQGLQQKLEKSCFRCNKNTWHVESNHILQPPNYLIIVVNRFRYINNQFAKDKCSIPIDMTVVLGYHKFSLQATIDHHGPSIYSGHYTTSVNCCNRTFYCNDNKITEFDMINTKNSSTAYVVIYKLIT